MRHRCQLSWLLLPAPGHYRSRLDVFFAVSLRLHLEIPTVVYAASGARVL
jgi:hypothetical protein